MFFNRLLGQPIPAPSDDARIIEADLFAEGTFQGETGAFDLLRGVRHYPLPGQAVYLTTNAELRLLYQSAEAHKSDEGNPMIPLGRYVGAEATECFADLNKLFGLHCAVLGSTGCGKSATVASVLHSLVAHKPKKETNLRPRVILIDPHGEYTNTFGKRAAVFRAYSTGAEDNGTHIPLKLPYWLLSSEEFRELVIGKTEREATSENNIVFKAVAHSRLVQRGWIEETKDWENQEVGTTHPADPRPKKDKPVEEIANYDADTPDPFSLEEFEKHVWLEQGVRIASKKWKAMAPSDLKSHTSVLDKLKVLLSDSRLAFMMSDYQEKDPGLTEVLAQFFGEIPDQAEADIRVIDISGLPNEVAGPLTAAIARLLFQFKIRETQADRERNPLLLICEEAHRYVPDAGLAEYQSAQKSIRRIAKEGLKYGLGLMLVSQRPSDVERTVLSQCNTWIIMRLTNTTDQEYVARFLPDSLIGLNRLLPSLTRQEALFVGDAAVIPARVMIRSLLKEQLPNSANIPFVEGWSQPPLPNDEIGTVVERWRSPGTK